MKKEICVKKVGSNIMETADAVNVGWRVSNGRGLGCGRKSAMIYVEERERKKVAVLGPSLISDVVYVGTD